MKSGHISQMHWLKVNFPAEERNSISSRQRLFKLAISKPPSAVFIALQNVLVMLARPLTTCSTLHVPSRRPEARCHDEVNTMDLLNPAPVPSRSLLYSTISEASR